MIAGAQRAFGIASKVKLTFDEYLRQYPQGEGFFELVDGELIEMDGKI